jgi:hypothetical protein
VSSSAITPTLMLSSSASSARVARLKLPKKAKLLPSKLALLAALAAAGNLPPAAFSHLWP